MEHFTCSFAVAGSDDGGMYPDEVAFLEKAVDGTCKAVACAEDGAIKIGAWAEVCNGAQEFWGVSFFLEGVVLWGDADEFYAAGLDFPFLFAWAWDERADDGDGCARCHEVDVFVARDASICDDLE